ncbi:MAG: cold shock domain-containing protein [Chloroflexi bacterium]|nr:cold shock domain-containing protein [Chloroflexota bacterium]
MAESGAIARIIGDRGYGLIRDARGQELFFHATSVEVADFEETA